MNASTRLIGASPRERHHRFDAFRQPFAIASLNESLNIYIGQILLIVLACT
jgi:hypothetical protein